MEIGADTIFTGLHAIWSALSSSGPLGVAAFFMASFIFVQDRHRLYRFLGPYGRRSLDAWIRRWELGADLKETELGTREAHKAAAEVLLASLQQGSIRDGVRTSAELRIVPDQRAINPPAGAGPVKETPAAQRTPPRRGPRRRIHRLPDSPAPDSALSDSEPED